MTARVMCVLALLVGVSSGLHGDPRHQTDQEIVDSFFPKPMTRGVHRDHMHAKWSRASLHGAAGEESIVAVYTNGNLAAVSVIDAQEGIAPRVVSTFESREMTGLAARLELLDLDDDGFPEIGALLAAAGGNSRTWLFKWTDGALRPIGPTVGGHLGSRVTLLGDPLFLDVDGDGSREAVNFPDESDAGGAAAVYRLRDGSFVPAGFEVVFYGVVVERGHPGEVEEVSFLIEDVRADYVLTLVNGDEHGRSAVGAAGLTIDGKRVAMQEHGDGSASSSSVPMRLEASNRVTVSLRGAPGSHVSLFVHTPDPAVAGRKVTRDAQ